MKTLSLKSLTSVLALSMVILLLALPSCKTLDTATAQLSTVNKQLSTVIDTVVIHDSVFVREFIRGDTVYLNRVQYRDRWRTHIVHDTIIQTDSIVRVIEHPPERYIPSFYKTSTIILWLMLAAIVLWFIIRKYVSIIK